MRLTILLLLAAGCAEGTVDRDPAVRHFVADSLSVRIDQGSAFFDLDGDGDPDDQVAQVIGGLFSWNTDLDGAARWALEMGVASVELEERQAERAAIGFRAAPLEKMVMLEGSAGAAGPARDDARVELPILVGEAPLSFTGRGLRVEYRRSDNQHIAGRLGGLVPADAIANQLIPELARLVNARISSETSGSEIGPLLANLDWGGGGCATAGDRRVDACELAEHPFWKRTLAPDVAGGLSFSVGFTARQH